MSDTKNKELINGIKQHEGGVYYQLPKEKYSSVIDLIHSIHIAPFGNHITESEKRILDTNDYRLLIEIQYHNQEKVEVLTSQVMHGHILWGAVVKNHQTHYILMDNKDMDTLINYVDPEMVPWVVLRPYF